MLSFSRMENGKFVQVGRPFDFHKSIQLVAMSHRPQTNVNGVQLEVDLDPAITKLGTFIGDEMRLRQVTSNLVSNALKFTVDGSVKIVTQLRHTIRRKPLDEPHTHTGNSWGAADPEKGHVASEDRREEGATPEDRAIVRVEIRDTGVGISTTDLADNRLFSPYVQTEIGRRQGGKGSGLGLALVRQIVELSGGRLGVDSEVGVGSTFW